MNVNAFVLLFLLLNLCVTLGKRENKAMHRGQRRRLHPQGRKQAVFVNYNLARQSNSRHSHSAAKVLNINADESTVTFLDSFMGVDETETSYNVVPGRQGHCKANGMIMYNKAVWSPKPCLTCLCSSGKVVCDEMSCPILKCARTIIPTGECCPICTSIAPNDPGGTYHPVILSNQDLYIDREEQVRKKELEEELRNRKDEEQERKSEEKRRNDEERQRELEKSHHQEEMRRQMEEEELQKALAEQQKHLHEEFQESKTKEEKQQLEKEMRNHSEIKHKEEEQDDDYDEYNDRNEYEEEQEGQQEMVQQEEEKEKEQEEEEKGEEEEEKQEEEQGEEFEEEQEFEEEGVIEKEEEGEEEEGEEEEGEEEEGEEEEGEEEEGEEEEGEEEEGEEEEGEEEEGEEEEGEEEEGEEEGEEEEGEEEEGEEEEEEEEEGEEEDYADVFELPLFHSILGSIPFHPDEEAPRFSLPVGCDITDFTVNCNNAKLTQIPPVSDLELKNLYLAGNSITTIPAGAFNGIPNLELIDFSGNKILFSNIDPAVFKRLKKLERLYMDQNLLIQIPPQLPRTLVELKINDNLLQRLDEETFQGLSKIVNLELEGNKLSESNVQPLAFRPLTRLAYLRMGKNKFRILPQGLPPSIEELYLEHNEIEEISEVSLNKTINLNVVVLRNNKLDETRIAPFAWIKLENLEYLDLSHNKIIHVPSFLPKGLLYLILVHNQIERIPGFVFAHMQPGLEILYLSFNKLTSYGIDPVSFFGTYDTMRELFLDHNMLRRIPVGIAEMKALHFLRLNDNLIRNVPLESICTANDQDDSNIRTLHLENNYINIRRIPPNAFCCIELYSSIVLTPQKVKK